MVRAALIVHDDVTYLPAMLEALGPEIPATVFVNRQPWHGPSGNWQMAQMLAEQCGAEVILGDWADETAHREASLEWARAQGIMNLLLPDTDEILSSELRNALLQVAAIGLSDQVHVEMDTYWKSPEYVIRPRERLRPVMMVNPLTAQHVYIRDYRGSRPLVLPSEHGVMHHLSYAGPEDRIVRKLSSWSHRDEVVPDWYTNIWQAWDDDRTLKNLHPTHPECYGWAERIGLPEILRPAWDAYLAAHGGLDPLHPEPIEYEGHLPRVSVIIPLYGGPEDIKFCLASLDSAKDLIHEVIVVDDASPDDAAEVAETHPGVKLLRNAENVGFAATCNRGVLESTGDVVVLLNSDTLVPRPGFIRLIESLSAEGSIAAAGPLSNRVGHFQLTDVTYTSKSGVTLFADDFARRQVDDTDTDMLVGFCLAIKRSVWDEVGPLDETFKTGMFEDNDLCYRMRRAGYRLAIARRSFIHHEGNASLERSPVDKFALFDRNEHIYKEKWRRDVELGFASHLAGTAGVPIHFEPSRRPDKLERELSKLVKRANITLSMIVRNEERVLEACLESARPFFTQIVVVDTGSTDRTVEIAKSFGAEVREMVWPDSFAGARNESMRHATGNWVFWMDADDTLPWPTGEALVREAIRAPQHIGGFVIPVRFVNDDPTYGTRVDHVKLFRNRKGLLWEGRIHEQILGSLRDLGLEIGRLPVEVLHSGYDTSEEGQARKRERDARLLALDLEDRPGHPFVLFNLGMTAHYNGEHETAIDWLEQSLERSKPTDSIVRKTYSLITVSLRELGRVEAALAKCEEGLSVCPQDPELLFHRGLLLSASGRTREAIEAYKSILGQDISGHLSSIDIGITGYKTHLNIAAAYTDIGDYRMAKEHYELAIKDHPRFVDSAIHLFWLAHRYGDRRTAEACLRHIEHLEGRSERWGEFLQAFHQM